MHRLFFTFFQCSAFFQCWFDSHLGKTKIFGKFYWSPSMKKSWNTVLFLFSWICLFVFIFYFYPLEQGMFYFKKTRIRAFSVLLSCRTLIEKCVSDVPMTFMFTSSSTIFTRSCTAVGWLKVALKVPYNDAVSSDDIDDDDGRDRWKNMSWQQIRIAWRGNKSNTLINQIQPR